MRDKNTKKQTKLHNGLPRSVMELLFDRFIFLKPSLPCSFHITQPCNYFTTLDIIFSWLELFVNVINLAWTDRHIKTARKIESLKLA